MSRAKATLLFVFSTQLLLYLMSTVVCEFNDKSNENQNTLLSTAIEDMSLDQNIYSAYTKDLDDSPENERLKYIQNQIFYSKFVGKWKYRNQDGEYSIPIGVFDNIHSGKAKIDTLFIRSEYTDDYLLKVVLSLYEGEYKENWLSVTTQFRYSPSGNSEINLDLDKIEFNYSSSSTKKISLLKHHMNLFNEMSSSIDKLDLLNLKFVKHFNSMNIEGIEGSLVSTESKICIDLFLDLDNGINYNLFLFTAVLSIYGAYLVRSTLDFVKYMIYNSNVALKVLNLN